MRNVADSSPRGWYILLLLPLVLFWFVITLRIPDSFSQYFHQYSIALFLIVLLLYYVSFRLPAGLDMTICLGLTMLLAALSLSYIWRAAFSDNFIISGLLPYKDAKNYFLGTQLLLHGLPMVDAGQATERPLFPGFLAGLLWLTGQNLKLSTTIITQLAALGIYFAARQIRSSLGAFAAGLFATLLYFYIQPLVGYTMSEALGFIAGCFGFALIWSAAQDRKRLDLALGIFILLIAVSARAGAFFIFPLLSLWVGWIFRGERQFSIKALVFALVGILLSYILINTVHARILGIAPGSSFANFSYALYGQVRGGTGWHSAIADLGTRDPTVVYRESWIFFKQHPASLLIGFAKSYRDFFFTGSGSIFPFGDVGQQNWLNSLVRIAALVLLVTGLMQAGKEISSSRSALILAGFIGIFLSIPFLPPIDGGSRFQAGTVPFFFAIPALGMSRLFGANQSDHSLYRNLKMDTAVSKVIAGVLIVLTLIFPPLARIFTQTPSRALPACPEGQEPFSIEYYSGSYVDLIRPGSDTCDCVPEVCRNEFETHNVEKSTDDFYQALLKLSAEDESNPRLIPAFDLVNGKFHYFYMLADEFSESPMSGTISGCAEEIQTECQSIYNVKSWSPVAK